MVIILTGTKCESACTPKQFPYFGKNQFIASQLDPLYKQYCRSQLPSSPLPANSCIVTMYVRISPVPRKQYTSLTETNRQIVTVPSPTACETTTYKHVHTISVMEGMVIYRTALLRFFNHDKFSTIQITIRDEVTVRIKHKTIHITKLYYRMYHTNIANITFFLT